MNIVQKSLLITLLQNDYLVIRLLLIKTLIIKSVSRIGYLRLFSDSLQRVSYRRILTLFGTRGETLS